MADEREFLVRILRAVLSVSEEVTVVGGCAHQLHALHEWASPPRGHVLRTQDVDLVPPGNVASATARFDVALGIAGCRAEPSGEAHPPATRYVLEEDPNLYVQFITHRTGGERRDGSRDETVVIAGAVAEKLRHVDLLTSLPWQVQLTPTGGFPVGESPLHARVCNAASFIAQKLLIRDRRVPKDRAKDIAYVYDTLVMFSGALEHLSAIWAQVVREQPDSTGRNLARAVNRLVASGQDDVREAAALLGSLGRERSPSPDELRRALDLGLRQVFSTTRKT